MVIYFFYTGLSGLSFIRTLTLLMMNSSVEVVYTIRSITTEYLCIIYIYPSRVSYVFPIILYVNQNDHYLGDNEISD
jgi:hypothetical protein